MFIKQIMDLEAQLPEGIIYEGAYLNAWGNIVWPRRRLRHFKKLATMIGVPAAAVVSYATSKWYENQSSKPGGLQIGKSWERPPKERKYIKGRGYERGKKRGREKEEEDIAPPSKVIKKVDGKAEDQKVSGKMVYSRKRGRKGGNGKGKKSVRVRKRRRRSKQARPRRMGKVAIGLALAQPQTKTVMSACYYEIPDAKGYEMICVADAMRDRFKFNDTLAMSGQGGVPFDTDANNYNQYCLYSNIKCQLSNFKENDLYVQPLYVTSKKNVRDSIVSNNTRHNSGDVFVRALEFGLRDLHDATDEANFVCDVGDTVNERHQASVTYPKGVNFESPLLKHGFDVKRGKVYKLGPGEEKAFSYGDRRRYKLMPMYHYGSASVGTLAQDLHKNQTKILAFRLWSAVSATDEVTAGGEENLKVNLGSLRVGLNVTTIHTLKEIASDDTNRDYQDLRDSIAAVDEEVLADADANAQNPDEIGG